MRIISAKLKALATADGLVEFYDDVPLGKVYQVDADTIQEVRIYNTEKKVEHTKVIIQEHPTGFWIPLEVLDIGEPQ